MMFRPFAPAASASPARLAWMLGGAFLFAFALAPTAGATMQSVRSLLSVVERGPIPVCGPAPTAVNVPVPPVGSGGSGIPAQDVTLSSLTLSDISGAVTSIDVHVHLLHQQDGDLVLTLIAPDGTRVVLANHRGANGVNFVDTIFRDAAAAAICSGIAPFSGEYRPEEPIGSWSGNGTWTLEIEDSVPGNAGVLLEWWVDVVTASAGTCPGCQGITSGWTWNHATAAAASHQGISQDATRVVHSAGTIVESTLKVDGTIPWSRDFGLMQPLRPLCLRTFAGYDRIAVPGSDGFLYMLDASNGATVWSRSTRRATCSSDSIAAAASVQFGRLSDCVFQAAIPNEDLVLVGTAYACGTSTANKVYALNASSGTIRWLFNSTGTYAVDRVTGIVVDHGRNRAYAVTDKTVSMVAQNTIDALNTLNGARIWGRDLGAILVEPLLSARGLYVLSAGGELRLLDPDTGSDIWTLTLPLAGTASYSSGFAVDPLRNQLFMSNQFGQVVAVADNGGSAATLWTTRGGHVYVSVAVVPSLGRLYAGESAATPRLAQLDETTGAFQSYFQFSGAPGASPLQVLTDATIGSGYADARLEAYMDGRVCRLWIPWYGAGPHGGLIGVPEQSVAPSLGLTLQGSTTPPSPAVGQTVVDTLSVRNNGNRAPHAVDIRTPIPAGMSFLNGTTPNGIVFVSGTDIVTRLWDLQIGQTVAISITLRLNAAGPHARSYTGSLPCPAYRISTSPATLVLN